MTWPEYEQFLQKLNAYLIKHSGRALLYHLIGTQKLLHAWGNDDDICAAGLFHSIYGTNKFRAKAWPITDRETIRGLLGERAERLVHAFCTADRPRAFFMENGFGPDLRDLREIEAANLLEQGSRSKWLKHLRDSDISDAAKRAIDEHHANLSSRPQQVVQQTTTDRQ
jgi:hypothetical protein